MSSTDPQPEAPTPAGGAPVAAWIRRVPSRVFVLVVAAVLALLLIIAALANPGHRVGPVDPARPPVGGPELPAAS